MTKELIKKLNEVNKNLTDKQLEMIAIEGMKRWGEQLAKRGYEHDMNTTIMNLYVAKAYYEFQDLNTKEIDDILDHKKGEIGSGRKYCFKNFAEMARKADKISMKEGKHDNLLEIAKIFVVIVDRQFTNKEDDDKEI